MKNPVSQEGWGWAEPEYRQVPKWRIHGLVCSCSIEVGDLFGTGIAIQSW